MMFRLENIIRCQYASPCCTSVTPAPHQMKKVVNRETSTIERRQTCIISFIQFLRNQKDNTIASSRHLKLSVTGDVQSKDHLKIPCKFPLVSTEDET